MIAAKASPESLPPVTPASLLASVQDDNTPGFSGTIVAQMSLGLPSLPGVTNSASESSMPALLAGSHTLRLWYGGPDRQRVALLGTVDETDVFHSGTTVWQWDSSTHTATRGQLPTMHDAPAVPTVPTGLASLTPQQLASSALAAMNPSTVVTMAGNRVIADRSAYVVVLTPRDAASRVGSVHIAVDGSTKVPLGVQVFARGSSSAAIDIAFSDVTFRSPAASNFSFTPPPGAIVHNGFASTSSPEIGTATGPTVIGSGWSSVVEYRTTPGQVTSLGTQTLHALTRVSGPWGQGRLLDSALVSVLVTDDGRVFAGAVDPDVLYRAAAQHR
ncbi:MAG: hypothetical protein QOG80_1482 [Pseudonocardiales bacterium]|jgi:outer membrane lipoprotein-sorting protein|nr:hypothetical protein [Pseudonocardiales bacterium]